MDQLVSIKQEPEWIINDVDYVTAELYRNDQSLAYTQYEIRPYYENVENDYKCKVCNLFRFFYYIFILYKDILWLFLNIIGVLTLTHTKSTDIHIYMHEQDTKSE